MLDDLNNKLHGRISIIGIGNPMRGDDGAGPYIVEELKGQVNAHVINCEELPENFLGTIINSQPDTILIIDAINMGMKPGTVSILAKTDIKGINWSTHHSSLDLYMNYLSQYTRANIVLLGIQPKCINFRCGITTEVKESLMFLKRIIINSLAIKDTTHHPEKSLKSPLKNI